MDVLETALHWLSMGVAHLPVLPQSKRAAVKWARWQNDLPPESVVKSWFRSPDRNLGLVCGGPGRLWYG